MMDPITTAAPAAAPTSSAADSSAAVSAPAQGITGGAPEQVGSPAPASGSSDRVLSLPNPETDPQGYQDALDNMDDGDNFLFQDGKFEYKDDQKKDEPKELVEPGKEESIADDAPLTAEFVAKLPANVQRKLEQAQAMQDTHEEYAEFLKPEFQNELSDVLGDPRVQAVIQERKRGGAFSFNPEVVLTKDTLASLAAKAGVDIRSLDHSMDPEGTEAALLKIIGHGIEEGKAAGRIESAMTVKAEAAHKARVDFYDNGFKSLMEKVPALKSDLSISDPKHPTQEFQSYIRTGLESGKLSHEMIMDNGIEPMFMMFQAKNGGIQKILNRPVANSRARFLEDAKRAATKEAVSLVGRNIGSSPSSNAMTKHGIDGDRFLSDIGYQEQVMGRTEDPDIMDALDHLLRNRKW